MLPERLDATYVGEDGARHRPVMLHRAVFGSFERFIGLLIEHYAGRFPLWLAPRQVVVAPIVSEANDYAEEAVAALRARGCGRRRDLRNEKINYKVREHSLAKVPVILAVGLREVEERTVSDPAGWARRRAGWPALDADGRRSWRRRRPPPAQGMAGCVQCRHGRERDCVARSGRKGPCEPDPANVSLSDCIRHIQCTTHAQARIRPAGSRCAAGQGIQTPGHG